MQSVQVSLPSGGKFEAGGQRNACNGRCVQWTGVGIKRGADQGAGLVPDYLYGQARALRGALARGWDLYLTTCMLSPALVLAIMRHEGLGPSKHPSLLPSRALAHERTAALFVCLAPCFHTVL